MSGPSTKHIQSVDHIPHGQVAVSVLSASFKGTESRQLHCQVNDDRSGASCMRIHPAVPEQRRLDTLTDVHGTPCYV